MYSLPLIYMQTMISVLIPLYNHKVTDLIDSLIKLLKSDTKQFEILIGDDSEHALSDEILDKWKDYPLSYFHNEIPLGRSANRNMLAEKSINECLIFLDCDGVIPDLQFISKYIQEFDGSSVVCGGTIYQKSKPQIKEQILRWTYGVNREVYSADQRTRNPYNSFSSFNFCIPSAIFKTVLFDEKIKEYGHEDTLFGFELKNKGIRVKHIDNPMIHTGLESTMLFIQKTEKSIDGLAAISMRERIPSGFLEGNTLWRAFLRSKSLGLNSFLKVFFPFIKNFALVSLKSRYPNLYLFDIYKLAYLSKIQS